MDIDFFGNGLCLHCDLARNELMDFKQFNDETEKAWKKRNEKLQVEIDEILSKYPEKHHEDIIDNYSWDLHINQYKFPNLHRGSLVISIYNFLEDQLNRLCAIFSEFIDSKIKLKDLHGQGIERAFLYLSKVAGVDFSSMGTELPYIKKVNSLRNQIVHNGRILPIDANHILNQFVSKSIHLNGSAGNEVNLLEGFIQEFIAIQIEFFEKLDKEIQKYIQKVNN